MVAIFVVMLIAGTCAAGYGAVNWLMTNKAEKVSEKESSLSERTKTMEQESPEAEPDSKVNAVQNGTISEENEPAVVEIATIQEESEKPTNEVEKKITKEEKISIKELTTIEKKEAETYYKDTAFIGDSRTQGLQINAGIRSPKFFAGRGLNVKNALTEKVVLGKGGKKYTVIESLEGKQYKKIYICFGLNELGWSYPEVFIARYKDLIKAVRDKQEKAEIVVYGILPVTKKKSDGDKIFNMKNVKKFNKLIKQMAKEIEITYADLAPAIKDKEGFLPAESTVDGVHMNKDYCKRILAYIANKKI